MILYPEGLPLPVREGYDLSAKSYSPLLKTQLQSGRSRFRRLYEKVPTAAKVSWILSAPQAQIFEGWWQYDLESGSQWFVCELRFPTGMQLCNCHFLDIYSGPTLVGRNQYQFTADLELWERPLIDREWYEIAPEYILYQDQIDIAMNQAWPKADPEES